MTVPAGKDVEKELSSLLVCLQTYTATTEIRDVVSQEAGNLTTKRSSYTPLGYISYFKNICLSIFTAALFITARNRNNPFVHQRMNGKEKWYVYTMEY